MTDEARKNTPVDLPTTEQLEKERKRLRYKRRYSRTLRSTVAILIVVAAAAVLVATLWMPVLRIYGSSMVPTLADGQIVVSVKTASFEPGDIAAFYHGNKLLIKRYIAGPRTGSTSIKMETFPSTERRSTNRIWWKKPTAKRTLSCRIRSRTSAIS